MAVIRACLVAYNNKRLQLPSDRHVWAIDQAPDHPSTFAIGNVSSQHETERSWLALDNLSAG